MDAPRPCLQRNFLCARCAEIKGICNFFARFRRKVCVISTPDAHLFGFQRIHDLVKSFEDAMRVSAHKKRVHEIFCARGAPNFLQKFCTSFARFWRNNCVISTPNSRFFGMERNVGSDNCSRCFKHAQRFLAECTQFLCARRARIPKIL